MNLEPPRPPRNSYHWTFNNRVELHLWASQPTVWRDIKKRLLDRSPIIIVAVNEQN